MIHAMRVIRAFMLRDVAIATSYRLDFLLRMASILITVAALFFVARLIGSHPTMDSYGGYMAFATVGLAVASFFQSGFQSFAMAIRREQMTGTLESILMTPARIPVIVIASSFWNFVGATLNVLLYLAIAALLFKVRFQGNFVLALAILLLTTLVFSSLGIMSASFIMVFKKGDPLSYLVGAVSSLLGGVFFPIDFLPEWLQKVAQLLPITWGLGGLRGVLLQGQTLDEVAMDIAILIGFALVLVPLSLFCFGKAIQFARREGSLLHY